MHPELIALTPEASSLHARLHRRVIDVCDATGDFISWWGFRAIDGRVWALLALSRDPLSQAEVARTLGVSRALVSGAVSELRGYGLVRPLGEGRQAPYVAVMDILPVISDVMRRREWMLIERARASLDGALIAGERVKELGCEPAFDLERLRTLLSLTEVAQGFLVVLIGIRVPRGLGAMKGWLARAKGWTARLRESGSRA